jgi:hypothetical protein
MLALSNYYKKTSTTAKLVGDIMLFSAPLLSAAVMAAPFTEPLKSWLLFGINVALVVGKIITKFITDAEVTDTIDNLPA